MTTNKLKNPTKTNTQKQKQNTTQPHKQTKYSGSCRSVYVRFRLNCELYGKHHSSYHLMAPTYGPFRGYVNTTLLYNNNYCYVWVFILSCLFFSNCFLLKKANAFRNAKSTTDSNDTIEGLNINGQCNQ